MVLTLNLISLISRKALVPCEFDVHLRAALRKAIEKNKRKKQREVMRIHWKGEEVCAVQFHGWRRSCHRFQFMIFFHVSEDEKCNICITIVFILNHNGMKRSCCWTTHLTQSKLQLRVECSDMEIKSSRRKRRERLGVWYEREKLIGTLRRRQINVIVIRDVKRQTKNSVYSNQIDTVLGGKLVVDILFFLGVSVMRECENINKKRRSFVLIQTPIKTAFVDSRLLRTIHHFMATKTRSNSLTWPTIDLTSPSFAISSDDIFSRFGGSTK